VPVALAGPWCFALGVGALRGVSVCSGEDEEGEEGCGSGFAPSPAPRPSGSGWGRGPGGCADAALRGCPGNSGVKPLRGRTRLSNGALREASGSDARGSRLWDLFLPCEGVWGSPVVTAPTVRVCGSGEGAFPSALLQKPASPPPVLRDPSLSSPSGV